MTQDENVQTRRGKTRVRTGCNACKSAHVKCREQRPACDRCQWFDLGCAYPVKSKPASHRQILAAPTRREHIDTTHSHALIKPAKAGQKVLAKPEHEVAEYLTTTQPTYCQLDSCNVIYYDYFRLEVAPYICLQTDSPIEFWNTTVLREANQDQCVLDAVVAIGAVSLAQSSGQSMQGNPFVRLRELHKKPKSTHYRHAVTHFIKAISSFNRRVVKSKNSPDQRKLLMVTLLFVRLEVYLGSSEVANKLADDVLLMLKDVLLKTNTNGHRSLLAGAADDRGIEEIEVYFVRRSAVFVMQPQHQTARTGLLSLSRPRLPAPIAPPCLNNDADVYLQEWWRFYTFVLVWNVRVLDTRIASGYMQHMDPTFLEEQHFLVAQLQSWEKSAKGHLTQGTKDLKSTVMIEMTLVATMLARYSSHCSLDATDTPWVEHKHIFIDLAPLAWSLIVKAQRVHFEDWKNLHEFLWVGLLWIARECRLLDVRITALELCKSIGLPHTAWDPLGNIMATSYLVTLEESSRGNHQSIPWTSRYAWTGSSWDDTHDELSATFTNIACVDSEGRHEVLHAVLRPEEWTFNFPSQN